MTDEPNRYLSGNYAPVREELTLTELTVEGTLPDFLDGRYLRIGPNPVAEVAPDSYHWFLGDGMVHGVRLRDGAAQWYRNRYVRSSSVRAALGEPPAPPGPRHGLDFAANTNVLEHAGRTLALVEAGPLPYELDGRLETVGPCDFGATLHGAFTAHPYPDPVTGELHAVAYHWAWGSRVRYLVIGTDGRVRRTVDIPVTGNPMMHDFSLTADYVVLYDLPVVFDSRLAVTPAPRAVRPVAAGALGWALRHPLPERVSSRLAALAGRGRDGGGAFPYRWDDSYPARVGLLPREGRAEDVRWFEVEPCFVFHALNAYAEGDSVVLDVVRHPSMFATDLHGPSEGPPSLDRWTLDLASGKVHEQRLDDQPQEFPRIDERRLGRRHRYGYTTATGSSPDDGAARDDGVGNRVFRHDLVGATTTSRSFGAGQHLGELVFVPRSDDSAEDDGVLLGYLHDLAEGSTQLLVLDAASLQSVASVHLPVRIPYGFHGNWLPARS